MQNDICMYQKLLKLATRALNFGIHPNLMKANGNCTVAFNTDKLALKFVTLTTPSSILQRQ